MDKIWKLREEYHVKNAREFLLKQERNYSLALKSTPRVASKVSGMDLPKDEIIEKLLKVDDSEQFFMKRCLEIGCDTEHTFNLVEHDPQKDMYHIRIWDLTEVDSDEYLDLYLKR